MPLTECLQDKLGSTISTLKFFRFNDQMQLMSYHETYLQGIKGFLKQDLKLEKKLGNLILILQFFIFSLFSHRKSSYW